MRLNKINQTIKALQESLASIKDTKKPDSANHKPSIINAQGINFMTSNAGNLNNGSDCFLNAVSQGLYHMPSFRAFIDATPIGQSATLDLLRKHILTMQNATTATNVKDFRQNICKFIKNTEMTSGQHDAQEFLSAILDTIKTELANGQHTQAATKINKLINLDLTIINAHDSHTSTPSTQSDPLLSVALSSNDLSGCIGQHFKSTTIDGYECQDCKKEFGDDKRVTVQQTTKIVTTPQMLVVQLKCFGMTETYEPVKNLAIVKVPDILKINNDAYKVVSFVVHKGTTVNGGHYWNYSLTKDGKWFCYNDIPAKSAHGHAREIPTKVAQAYLGQFDDPRLQKEGNRAEATRAYLLFFEKIIEAVDEDLE